MKAGTLNRLITIQSPATGQDAYGQPTSGWTTVATVWAAMNDVTGREFVAAGAVQNAATTKVTIRHRDGLVAGFRVVYGADTYNVEAVLGQDRRMLVLMCVRGAANG